MAEQYTYQTFDLATRLIMEEIPFEVKDLPDTLNGPAVARFRLPIYDGSGLPKDWQYAVIPGRTGVVAIRDGIVVWSGILWESQTADNGQAKEYVVPSMVGFYAHQTLDADMPFNQVDQHTIARNLGAYVDTQAGGNIGVSWGTGLSGILRDRTEWLGSEHNTILELWQSLSNIENGIDFRIETTKTSGSQVSHAFIVGSPLGATGANLLAFDFHDEAVHHGGNILSYVVNEFAATNAVWGLGAGEGVDMLQVLGEKTALLSSGWPRIVDRITHKSVSELETLQGHVALQLSEAGQPVPEIVVDGSVSPKIGEYRAGDHVSLRIKSPEFPMGFTGTYRIYSTSIDPINDTCKITFQKVGE